MKKTLLAVIAVLCVILALGVAALIYLEVNSRSGGIADNTPSTQDTAPASGDTHGTTVPGDTTAPEAPAQTTQEATMPTFQTEDPNAAVTPEITFPEEPEQTQPAPETQGTAGADTDDNATPDIDF